MEWKWWKVMESFSNVKNFKSPKKVMEPFSVLKTLSQKAVVEFFLSFKSFKSRKKMTESFFSGHGLLSFLMMIKFPGTTFSL